MEVFVKRCDKIAFYGVPGENGTVYKRMTGFTNLSVDKNPKEYKRQYIDQEFEQCDIVGFSPAVSFTFDQFTGNGVHDDIMNIADKELLGNDAVREIIMVDTTKKTGEKYSAVKREFAVIVENEGDDMQSYKIKGTFRVKGEKIFGTAQTSDNFETVTFTEE